MEDIYNLRIRSDNELKAQNLGLKELSQILNDKKIKNFITGGTLLGAIREKNFIKWDWDVEITILTDQIFSMKDGLCDLFLEADFEILKYLQTYDSLKWTLTKYNSIYEIVGFYREGEWMYRTGKGTKVPANLFDNPSNLFFLGNSYQTVSDPEKYLEFCYGDWQTPKKTANKKEYLTLEHQPRLKMYNIFFQKIKNLFVK